MTPWYANETVSLHLGDVRTVLRSLPADSIQMTVTSPPYWSLRDYGVEPTIWSREADCEHVWGSAGMVETGRHDTDTASLERRAAAYHTGTGVGSAVGRQCIETGTYCLRCNAWRGALGLEPTPELYVEHMVDVFREVRRVMRPDATLWLNIGDSYSSGGRSTTIVQTIRGDSDSANSTAKRPPPQDDLKPKDLVGIPWMLAFALRADGWWLRQDIIWAKPNPMPESVRDRCTKAHEYLFLLSKSERYYYDQDAIRESQTEWDHSAGLGGKHQEANVRYGTGGSGFKNGTSPNPDGRNKRSVWTVATKPFSDSHFASFPPELITPCILAGSKPGDVVLDPFIGTGTTAVVARQYKRRAIGIDLGEKYLRMAKRRIAAKHYYREAPQPSDDNPFAIKLEYNHGSQTNSDI